MTCVQTFINACVLTYKDICNDIHTDIYNEYIHSTKLDVSKPTRRPEVSRFMGLILSEGIPPICSYSFKNTTWESININHNRG